MLVFKNIHSAQCALAGIEVVAMIKKGQIKKIIYDTTDFLDALVTDMPIVQSISEYAAASEKWEGDNRGADTVLGDHFREDGSRNFNVTPL